MVWADDLNRMYCEAFHWRENNTAYTEAAPPMNLHMYYTPQLQTTLLKYIFSK